MARMQFLIEMWAEFTDSLQYAGGTIALLFIVTFLLGAAVMYNDHAGYVGGGAKVIEVSFSNFTGALLLALTRKTKNDGDAATINPIQPVKAGAE